MLGDFDATVDRTTDHLGLPRFEHVPPLQNRHAGAELVARHRADRRRPRGLAELYAADLAVFEELSGIDTSAWPTDSILAGSSTRASSPRGSRRKVAPRPLNGSGAVPDARSGAPQGRAKKLGVRQEYIDSCSTGATGARGVDDLAAADVERHVVDRAAGCSRSPRTPGRRARAGRR